ncbi:MAG TPA: TIGR02281 family clan AA aspartic protease [Gammaproteobacteria bacterium]|nr:TIGR02281 family clan AA aspartic protease [Gammaproteobacteria bacterium]
MTRSAGVQLLSGSSHRFVMTIFSTQCHLAGDAAVCAVEFSGLSSMINVWISAVTKNTRYLYLVCFFLPISALLAVEPPADISLSVPVAPAPPRLALEALLGRKAVININGQRAVLAVGERKPSGLHLLSLQGDVATVGFDSRQYRLRLGQAPISTRYVQPELAIITIAPDPRGMYLTPGAINGQPVQFLVDTGATTVAMNAIEARRLGVDYLLRGRPVAVDTASGRSQAWFVELNEVSVGGIKAHNVGAVVLEGGFPQQVLLGMSFLGPLQIQRHGMLLELRQKY